MGKSIFSYVAVHSDEEYREGYRGNHLNMKTILPFKEAGIDKQGVIEILNVSGLGLPTYYNWRSRNGCTFCFFQQKIEWVRLKELHPDAFDEARRYEKNAMDHGSPFSWTEDETLDELTSPERTTQIKQDLYWLLPIQIPQAAMFQNLNTRNIIYWGRNTAGSTFQSFFLAISLKDFDH